MDSTRNIPSGDAVAFRTLYRGTLALATGFFRTSVIATLLWSIVVSTWELSSTQSLQELVALLTAKTVVSVLGGAAIASDGRLRTCFAFLCGVSVVAVAPTLLWSRLGSDSVFALSAVDCICRMSVVVSYLLWRQRRGCVVP